MTLYSFLRNADTVATVVVNVTIICFAFPAYRRSKMLAFPLMIVASAMGIVMTCGLALHRNSPSSNPDYLTFIKLYRVGYLITSVLGCVSAVQLIQFVQKFFERKATEISQESTVPGTNTKAQVDSSGDGGSSTS